MGTPVLERLDALADETRSRVLLLLDRHELAVGELCSVLQLPQSTVSRHLKVLLEPEARRLWQVVRAQLADGPAATQDAERLRSVLAERRTRSQEFFSAAAAQWDALRGELFGQRADLLALPGLLDESWTVGDLGCGTGQVAAALAPFVRRVVAVDQSRAMLASARVRLREYDNVEVRGGDLEQLPLEDRELDAALLLLVLHYIVEPPKVPAEARRALKPGGRLLVMDMTPHARDEYRQTMGHVWQGFSAEQMTAWAAEAGLERLRYRSLPPDPQAKGPGLFAATMRRPPATRTRGQ